MIYFDENRNSPDPVSSKIYDRLVEARSAVSRYEFVNTSSLVLTQELFLVMMWKLREETLHDER